MTIEEIYKKGTAKQLWEAWDASQRTHFLIDHYDMFGTEIESDVNKYAQKFSHSSWKDIPNPIQKQVAIHHAMGFYGEGGRAGMKEAKYIVTIFDKNKGWRANFTIPLSKEKAEQRAEELKEQMKKSIPKYQFAEDIKVEKTKPGIIYKEEGGPIESEIINPKMKTYLTPAKKQLLSKITSIREKMQKVKDPQVLESLEGHIRKLEDILNKKIPTRTKIQNWKQEKQKRLKRNS